MVSLPRSFSSLFHPSRSPVVSSDSLASAGEDRIEAKKDLTTAQVQNERGMTLVEILAVIVLLSLIMTFVIQAVSGRSDAAKAKLNVAKMGNLQSALANYRLEYGSFPARLEDLLNGGAAVKQSGRAFIALVKEAELKDIWQNPFQYEAQNNGRSYSLMSFGADGASGGTDANQDVTVGP